jgi:hypothetical protein
MLPERAAISARRAIISKRSAALRSTRLGSVVNRAALKGGENVRRGGGATLAVGHYVLCGLLQQVGAVVPGPQPWQGQLPSQKYWPQGT